MLASRFRDAEVHASARLGRSASSTRTGLFLKRGLSFEEWAQVGRHVRLVHDASCWWVGDWLAYGEHEYGCRYRDAVDVTGFDYQTLRNRAWVASRFPPSRRREALSFAHHAEVTSLPESEQDAWLDRAFVHGWSRNELRRRLRETRSSKAGDRVTIALAVPADRHDRWRAAASVNQRDLREWMEDVLDRAADDLLRDPASDASGEESDLAAA